MATQTQNDVKKSKIEKMDVMELDRNTILTKLSRQEFKVLLGKIEEKTKLQVEFENLPADCKVPAQYEFQRPDKPVVYLRQNWDDALVAHELPTFPLYISLPCGKTAEPSHRSSH